MVPYTGPVEKVFRALADPTRRALLDALFERDGQTLVALTAGHDMTRIAVAKHLRLLEEAGLVVSRRRGREKVHYLNPTAGGVYELCDGATSALAIGDFLKTAYELDAAPLDMVRDCLISLLDQGLVRPCPKSSAAP